jgi:hypothetical protein
MRAMSHGRVLLVTSCILALLLSACGGGGGSGSGSSGTGPTFGVNTFTPTPLKTIGTGTPVPTGSPGGATSTPTETETPSETPTPAPSDTATPTDTPIVSVHQGEDIGVVLRSVDAGTTVLVAAGTYGAVSLQAGDLQPNITLRADRSSDAIDAPVIINGASLPVAIDIAGQTSFTIDGLTIRGGTVAGVQVASSTGITIQNCTITGSTSSQAGGPGVRIVGSDVDNAVVFDNLITNRASTGVQVIAAMNIAIFNNTIYNNAAAGIAVSGGATSVQAENNIINHNTNAGTPLGIDVDRSDFAEGFNLNTDGYRNHQCAASVCTISTQAAATDLIDVGINQVFPAGGTDFHLAPGESPAIDAGDPTTDPDLVTILTARSTQANGSFDVPPVDLGYHYPPAIATPTPIPVPTRTPRVSTPTRTPIVAGATNTPGAGGAATPTPTRAAGTPGTPTVTHTPGGNTPTEAPTKTPTTEPSATPTATLRGPPPKPTPTPRVR